MDHQRERTFLVGARFSVADAYLAWALAVARIFQLDFRAYPALRAYDTALRDRPSIRAALALETPLAQAAMRRQSAPPQASGDERAGRAPTEP